MVGEDRRDLVVEGLRERPRRTDAVGEEGAAAVEKLRDSLPPRLVEGEALTAMHEDEVVVKHRVIRWVDERRRVIHPDADLAGGSAEDVGKSRRGRVAHARMPQLADRELAADERVGWLILLRGDPEEGVLVSEFAVGGVGEHVGADRESRFDFTGNGRG